MFSSEGLHQLDIHRFITDGSKLTKMGLVLVEGFGNKFHVRPLWVSPVFNTICKAVLRSIIPPATMLSSATTVDYRWSLIECP